MTKIESKEPWDGLSYGDGKSVGIGPVRTLQTGRFFLCAATGC